MDPAVFCWSLLVLGLLLAARGLSRTAVLWVFMAIAIVAGQLDVLHS